MDPGGRRSAIGGAVSTAAGWRRRRHAGRGSRRGYGLDRSRERLTAGRPAALAMRHAVSSVSRCVLPVSLTGQHDSPRSREARGIPAPPDPRASPEPAFVIRWTRLRDRRKTTRHPVPGLTRAPSDVLLLRMLRRPPDQKEPRQQGHGGNGGWLVVLGRPSRPHPGGPTANSSLSSAQRRCAAPILLQST